jgi:hypothetical protein
MAGSWMDAPIDGAQQDQLQAVPPAPPAWMNAPIAQDRDHVSTQANDAATAAAAPDIQRAGGGAAMPAAATTGGVVDRVAGWIDDSPLGDVGRSVARGGVAVGDAAAGLAGLVSGGYAPKAIGYDSSGVRAYMDSQDTPERQADRKALQDAQGFGGTLQSLYEHPGNIAHGIVESVPGMLAGGLLGRGATAAGQAAGLAPRAAGIVGTGAGEGAIAAGQTAEQARMSNADQLLTAGQTAAALGSGAATGALGALGARAGRMLGIGDVDSLLAGQNGADVARNLATRVFGQAALEGLEETGQSATQQAFGNAATGQPLMQGVGNAAAQGGVLGALMGAGGGIARPTLPGINEPLAQPGVTPAQGSTFAQVLGAPAEAAGGTFAQMLPQAAQQQAQQAAQAPSMPTPAPVDLFGQAVQEQPATAPAALPFAGSRDIGPMLDNLGIRGDMRRQSIDLLSPVEPDIEGRRRGVVSDAEQKQLASLIGLDGAQGLAQARKLGQAWNAEEHRAVTSLVQGQMAGVLDLQQRIVSGQATDIERAQFIEDVNTMRRTTGELLGARAEAGRALAAQRRQVSDIKQAQSILESVGGISGADDLATAISEAIKAGGLQNMAKAIQKPTHLTDYLKAGWLSGWKTHVANMAGNTGMIGVNAADRTNAALLAGAKRLFGLRGETAWSEPVALVSGAIRGQVDALAAAGRAFKEGESPMLGSGKAEQSSLPVRTRPGALGTAKLAFDNVALSSFRALGAEDAYFAVTNYEAQLRALATRTAVAEKGRGQLPSGMKASQRIEQLVSNPTPQMVEQAGDFARESTFNTKAGPFISKIIAAKAAMPWLNLVIPFVRTPANIIKRAVTSSPVGVLAPSVRKDIMSGGAKQEMAIGRMMTGTQIMMGAAMLAQAGYLSGSGPEDEKERRAWLAAGNQPYSVKVDGTWYSYNRLDPFASWMGTASDLALTDWRGKSAEDRMLKLLSTFAENIVSKTWMSGVEGLSQALSDPDRYAGAYLQRTGASVLQPVALASNIAATQDPYARKPGSLLEAIAARTPGMRQSVPARLDAWGQPIANNQEGGTVFNNIAPMTHTEASTDPVRLESARLGWSPVDRSGKFKKNGVDITLEGDQLAEYRRMLGDRVHTAIEQAMRSPGWAQLDDDQRREAMTKFDSQASSAAKIAMLRYRLANDRKAINEFDNVTNALKGRGQQ